MPVRQKLFMVLNFHPMRQIRIFPGNHFTHHHCAAEYQVVHPGSVMLLSTAGTSCLACESMADVSCVAAHARIFMDGPRFLPLGNRRRNPANPKGIGARLAESGKEIPTCRNRRNGIAPPSLSDGRRCAQTCFSLDKPSPAWYILPRNQQYY